MILTTYKYSFNIFLIEEKLKSGNGGIIIFECSECHINILEKLKLEGGNTIFEWS